MKNGGSFHSFLYVYQRVTSDTRPLRCLGTSMVPRHGVASLRNSARSGSTGQPGWWRLVIWQLARLGAGEGVKENPLVSLKLGWASPQIRPSLGTFYGKKHGKNMNHGIGWSTGGMLSHVHGGNIRENMYLRPFLNCVVSFCFFP